MNKQQRIDSFMAFMDVGNYSERTKVNYLSHLKSFLFKFNGQHEKATNEQLAQYISSQKSSASMRQVYGVLKLYYTYVLKRKNLFGFIPFPKNELRLRHLPTKQQVIEMIGSIHNAKHRCIVMLLCGTGIRLGELLALKWEDIKREQGENPLSLLIHGKGAKDRIVPISQNVYDSLISYYKEYKLGCKTDRTHYIFGSDKPYSARSVAAIVERYGKFKNATPHLLRHWCFQSLYDSGVALEKIQNLAGHKSFSTTSIYARLTPQKIAMPI